MIRDLLCCLFGVSVGALISMFIETNRSVNYLNKLRHIEQENKLLLSKNKKLYDDNCILRAKNYEYEVMFPALIASNTKNPEDSSDSLDS